MKNLWRLIWVLLGVVAAILFVNLGNRASARDYWHYGNNSIDSCRDIEYIFVRGSGQEQNEGAEWKEFEARMAEVSKYAHVSYRATDLDYPAVAITLNNVLGVYSSAGAATNFAESVWTGVIKLRDYVRHRSEACANSYFVLGGYSQGAMVIQEALKGFPTDRVIYVGLFGDPKLYLPEGAGNYPPACYGRNFSRYRVMVGNCKTNSGSLGARNPYEQGVYGGRYGLFCDANDFICGGSRSPLSNNGHLRYVQNQSIYIMSRITEIRIKYLRSHLEIYTAKSSSRDVRDEVVLILPADEYEIIRGDRISFDASQSFSISGAVLSYSWTLNGQELDGKDAILDFEFSDIGEYELEVTASTSSGIESSRKIKVAVKDGFEPPLPAPEVSALKRDDSSFRLSWNNAPDGAESLAVKIGDVFLGYADLSNKELIVEDYDFELKVAVAYMDKDGNLGEWVEVEIQNNEEYSALTLPDIGGWLFLFSLACVGLVISVIKLIRDIQAIKSAQKRVAPERSTRSSGTLRE